MMRACIFALAGAVSVSAPSLVTASDHAAHPDAAPKDAVPKDTRPAHEEHAEPDAAAVEHLTAQDAAMLQHEKDAALAEFTEHIVREELKVEEAKDGAQAKNGLMHDAVAPQAAEPPAEGRAFLSQFEFPVKPRPVFFAGDGDGNGSSWSSGWSMFEEMPLLFVLPGAAVMGLLVLLAVLVRYLLTGGLEQHWSAQLTSRTDWSKLSDGDFVKVVGHVSAISKPQEVISPLAGTKCVAYSVSVAYDKGGQWVSYTSTARVTSFTVLDENSQALLISETESYMYNLSTVKEWTYSTATAPKEFLALLQKKGEAGALPAMRLRFREEVLEVGAKVSCVGAVSTQRNTLPLESVCVSSVGSLRPAYATLMFRDERIPWAKMTELGTDDWAKLAASVLVSGYRPGR